MAKAKETKDKTTERLRKKYLKKAKQADKSDDVKTAKKYYKKATDVKP